MDANKTRNETDQTSKKIGEKNWETQKILLNFGSFFAFNIYTYSVGLHKKHRTMLRSAVIKNCMYADDVYTFRFRRTTLLGL